MTSAFFSAADRAELTFRGCVSGITPLPIGVGRKGML